MKQFKRGDKIKIIKDFASGRSGMSGRIGVFWDYTDKNQQKNGYYYVINTQEIHGLVCADIELMEEEKFEIPEKWCINTSNFSVGEYLVNNFVPAQDWYLKMPNNVNYFHFKKNNFHFWREIKDEEYTEITFEQFKKYILKQKTMEKELIGYRLKDEKYRNAVNALIIECGVFSNKILSLNSPKTIAALREANVLDVWFEAVYKEESLLKVGDWIYFLESSDDKPIGAVRKISGVQPDSYNGLQWVNYRDGGFRVGGNGYFENEHYRRATQKEIDEVTKVEIGGYTATIENGKIAFGCQCFSKEELLTIKRLFTLEINATISIHGVSITREIIDRLLELFD